MQLLRSHWGQATTFLALYAAAATWLIRVIPAPTQSAPLWKRILHFVLLDWPAALPKVNFVGFFNLPFNVPYLSWSLKPDSPSPRLPPTVIPVLLLIFAVSACAPGSDGARQALSSANASLGAGYRGLKAYVLTADADALARGRAGALDAAADEYRQTQNAAANGLRALDAAAAALDAADAALVAAVAAGQRDYGPIVAQVERVGADLFATLRSYGVKIPGVN